MTNTSNVYEHFELWGNEMWADRQSPLLPLATWISEHDVDHSSESEKFPRFPETVDVLTLPHYRAKTQSVDLPEVLEDLKDRGLKCSVLEMGQVHWISTVPVDFTPSKGKKLPVLMVLHHDDPKDPNWAMRTLEYYEAYHQSAIREKWIILYIVSGAPDYSGMFGNVLQEALVLYPGDEERVCLDVSVAKNTGTKLGDIPGYTYTDRDRSSIDPDKSVEYLGDAAIPVLDISRRWENLDSINRNLIMNYPMNKNDFNLQKVLHSATGKRMAKGFAVEHAFRDIHQPGYIAYWKKMGLDIGVHETKGERWITYSPVGIDKDSEEKLPVVVIMQEVNYSNEHLPINGVSCFYEYHEIASNGDAILLYFALEDVESNDLLVEILDEASEIYPIDRQRVYITGHSHNGFFSLIFARRHPDIIAAVATLGNPHGIMEPQVTGEAVFAMSDEQVSRLRQFDIPVINIMGCYEWDGADDPSIEYANWQRRLIASRCPMKSFNEIADAVNSTEKAERILAVPTDRSETLYMDGFEHYIGDVRNDKGAYHLRIVKIEGLPHVTTPFMQHLSWAFMRRFSRNGETGAIQELF